MSTITLFIKDIEKNHDVHRGKRYLKKFCESLREHAVNTTKFKKKKNEFINKTNNKNHLKTLKYAIFLISCTANEHHFIQQDIINDDHG